MSNRAAYNFLSNQGVLDLNGPEVDNYGINDKNQAKLKMNNPFDESCERSRKNARYMQCLIFSGFSMVPYTASLIMIGLNN